MGVEQLIGMKEIVCLLTEEWDEGKRRRDAWRVGSLFPAVEKRFTLKKTLIRSDCGL